MNKEVVDYLPPAQRKSLDIKKYTKNEDESLSYFTHHDFYTICDKAREYVYAIYDQKTQQKSDGETKEDFVQIYHDAILGIPAAVGLIKKIIENFVTEEGLRDVQFPEYYTSLVEGLFEEEFGWGPLSSFRKQGDCESAQVLGTDIKFKRKWGFELQPFKFRNIEQVLDLAKRFSNTDSRNALNKIKNPELETKTFDHIRVSIMIPERMHEEPVITLRKKVIKNLSFDTIVKHKTIPEKSIPLFESLSRFHLNGIIAGPPGCGKSTLLHILLHHSLYEFRKGVRIPERVNTIYAESYPEFSVREIHPKSNVLHLIGKGKEFEQVIMSALLRHDITKIALGEIREHEVGLFKSAGLRGIKQVIGTLHDLDPIDIPGILSDLYMQYYENGMDSKVVYNTFVKNVHFAISMDEFLYLEDDEEIFRKKVTGIHFYDVDPITKEPNMTTIMDYDIPNEKWIFKNNIPERIVRMVNKYHPKEFEIFRRTLEELAIASSEGNIYE